MQQLTLPLQLPDDATFANFYPADNQLLINYLQAFIQRQYDFYLYIWGTEGSGCSHLLQASCQYALARGLTAVYIPLTYINDFTPAILNDLENVALVCLDDIQQIAGHAMWEEAIFHLYNRIQLTQNRLIIGGHTVPSGLNIQLADLNSRLASGVIRQIHSLTDAEKIIALQLRARLRGFDLPNEVAQFLLNHFPRNFSVLFNILETMDQASLIEQRKLTVPFVKQVLVKYFP